MHYSHGKIHYVNIEKNINYLLLNQHSAVKTGGGQMKFKHSDQLQGGKGPSCQV